MPRKTAQDLSAISLNYRKALKRPPGVTEVEGYRERFRSDDQMAIRVFDVPWSSGLKFMQWALGYSYYDRPSLIDVSDAEIAEVISFGVDIIPNLQRSFDGRNKLPRVRIRREIPDQHPEMPWLYAHECNVVQCAGFHYDAPATVSSLTDPALAPVTVPMIAYAQNTGVTPAVFNAGNAEAVNASDLPEGKIRYEVTYRPRLYTVLDDLEIDIANRDSGIELGRYVTRKPQPAIHALPLNKVIADRDENTGALRGVGRLHFAEGPQEGLFIPEPGVLLLPTATYIYIWHEVPIRPHMAEIKGIGKVNKIPFDGRPAETLLCQAPTLEYRKGINGTIVWDIAWRFDYRRQGWNKFPANDGNFYRAVFHPSGNPIYEAFDFTQFFYPTKFDPYFPSF